MTTSTWNDGTADWYTNNGGDWTPAGDPGPSSAVVINSGEPELESGDAAISVASISITGGLLAIQDPGVTQSVSGNVSLSGNGALALDGADIGGAGGSSMTIGGTLANTSTNSNGIDVGNTGISSADSLTVNGTGGLSNASTSEINIFGSATVQATVNVANAAAGFGTAGEETGTVWLQNDALLEFKSGQITTVNGELWLDGANSRVAVAGTLGSNSALTGLTSVSGNFYLENGATVATTGALSVTGNGTLGLDGNNTDGPGGSSLTVGGTLTNSSTNNNGVSVGNTGISSADTLTVNGTGGLSNASASEINIFGSATVQATVNVANAAAGFGTAGEETGTVWLQNDALLEFKSGQIITVNGELWLDGAKSYVADAGTLTTNSALTGLTGVSGNFYLENGATVATTGALSVTGNGTLGLDGNNTDGPGGSSLTVGGTLTNSSTNNNGVSVGNTGISSADTLTVNGTGGLSNASASEINIFGSATVQATVNVANAAAGFGTAGEETGTVWLQNDALLEFKSGQITTVNGELWLDGANSRVADAGTLGSNSALTGLASVSGNFYLENGATVTTGALSVTGNGTLGLDGNNTDGPGGSSLTVGGKLTNNSTNNNGVSVGNTGIASADTLTVSGVLGISNTGEINIEGSATVQATLDVADHAAGFGTTGVETGTVFLENDALLEFNSGQIATVDGELWLDGANSRVARAAAPATNSALTGLTTVSGSFYLENGAKVSPTGNVSVTGGGTMELDGNNTDGAGGSKLTIAGTLTNSSTNGNGVNVGNTNITVADTLTVNGAGGLSNTGEINIVGGSATAIGTLDVTKTATSSGTIVIGAFGELKAATVDVTGGSVVIDASGDLTATTINVTGGTLEGVGTVTGTLNDTGGTVVGGNLNSTTGTLNVDGAYEQSGSGVLQTDINTGDSQQSSIISVTGTPGTPGAAGSVNLAGGTLLIDAQSSLALNTPYTVMTFGADDLYGQFGGVETEGSLGSHTGKGDGVNLGNGDTLEVLYNEAAGDIQVEVVATPASTTYTWDVGGGTWNASSGADWNPPGNGTVPSQTSNVEIGTGGGGTVTLAQDQTIASLSITNGYTLSGATHSITVTGNVSVASGAVLSIDDMNVDGAFTDSGSATFKGALTINSGGQFTLSNGTLSGGINGAGTFETASGTTGTLTNVTIYKGTTYTTGDGATTDINGAISNRGTFLIDGASGNAIVNLGSAVTLSGGGVVTMESGSGNAYLRGGGLTLTNTANTIQGAGLIGDNGALTIVNKATIDANSSGQSLSVSQGGGAVTNTGTLEATGGGTLQLFSKVTNTGGAITASGANSVVNVDSITIVGGTLNTAGGGLLQTVGSSDLNGVTISVGSTYTTGDGATTQLDTSLTNDGTFLIDGASGNAVVNLGSNVTLSGGGTVTMESNSGAAYLRGNGVTLTNTNNTIQGTGNIGDSGVLTIDNESTVDANASGMNLNISSAGGSITNTGTLEATNGATLTLFNAITNTGGAITANGGTVNVDDATIVGGTLNATGANVMQTVGSSDLNGVTISTGSTYTTGDGATTQLDTSLVNDGTFVIDGSAGNAIVNLGSNVTLSGGGTVTMKSSSGSAYLRGIGVKLTNTNNTIQGAGFIGDSGALTIVNKATIDANSKGQGLNVNEANGGVTNTATLEATNGASLNLFDTITNTGGAITASGTGSEVNVDDATIVGGTLNTTGGGVMQTVNTSELNGVTISSGTTYLTAAGETTQLDGAIANDGTFAINGASGNAIVNLVSSVTLSGGGTIAMSSGSAGSAYLRGNGVTLTNTNNTIQGAGFIGDSGMLTIVNQATIDANSSGQGLNVNEANGGVTNTATLEATNGASLNLFDTITNTGGAITASGTGSEVNVNDATIIGGTLNTVSGGVMETVGSSDLNGVTISSGSAYAAGPGTTTQLNGVIVNDGTFAINGASGSAIVNLGSSVTLSGGGTVTLSSGASSAAYLRGSGVTLTNTNDTIQGAGNIGDSGVLAIDNEGTIDANSSGQSLNLGQAGGGLTNTGVFEATAGGHLYVDGALSGAGQLKVGANAEVELGGVTSENTTFLSATAATLLIDNATTTTYGGVISSFAKGDILELGNTDATKATPTFNSGPDTTTLTVDLSSGGPLVYTLAGNLSADTFGVTVSGSNSSIAITADPAFEEAASLLGGHTASPFVESSGVFGASNTAGSAQLNLAASLHAHSLT